MAKFQVGDLVKVQGIFLGRIVAIEQESPLARYGVELNDNTGLIRSYPDYLLEPYERPDA